MLGYGGSSAAEANDPDGIEHFIEKPSDPWADLTVRAEIQPEPTISRTPDDPWADLSRLNPD